MSTAVPLEAQDDAAPGLATWEGKSESKSENKTERFGAFALAALTALFLASVVRFAWLSDDGFITGRSIQNLLLGHGLVTNVGQRVQSYTSPLWMLLSLPFQALTGSPYPGLMLPGLVASAAFAVIVFRGFRGRAWAGAAVLAIVTASPSFLTFSTSGLENSLAHALCAAFCLERLRARTALTRTSFLLAGLLFLTRFDYVLLVAPSLVHAIVTTPRPRGRLVLRAAAPLLVPVGAWLLFATVYYGFPLPNTAYAKLNTAIPLVERVAQGLTYLVDATYRDPVMVVVIAGTIVWMAARRRSRPSALLALGLALYVGYIVWIGGDFMAGRFLTTGLAVAAIVMAHELALELPLALPVVTAVALLLGLPGLNEHRVDRKTECYVTGTGVVDERECYVEHTGLVPNIRGKKWKTHGYLEEFRKAVLAAKGDVVVFDTIGMAGFGAPRPVHVIERYALSEPLLARIRFSARANWRPGHYWRDLPEGYLESVENGTNEVKDPCLHKLYDRLKRVTSGPLFALDRLGAIAAMNFGAGTCPAPTPP
jgi:arabinofuranosyltransferase